MARLWGNWTQDDSNKILDATFDLNLIATFVQWLYQKRQGFKISLEDFMSAAKFNWQEIRAAQILRDTSEK